MYAIMRACDNARAWYQFIDVSLHHRRRQRHESYDSASINPSEALRRFFAVLSAITGSLMRFTYNPRYPVSLICTSWTPRTCSASCTSGGSQSDHDRATAGLAGHSAFSPVTRIVRGGS